MSPERPDKLVELVAKKPGVNCSPPQGDRDEHSPD
jgi:hypothetical protein